MHPGGFTGALPQILVGLRQSLGIAWLSLVVAGSLLPDIDRAGSTIARMGGVRPLTQ